MREIYKVTGGKGGGSKAHTPSESPDSLHSLARTRILLGLSEGEVENIATEDELRKRVMLDGTPIRNADGTENYPNAKVQFRPGTQSQAPIDGFPAVESETGVGLVVKKGTPWQKSYTNLSLDAVRIRIGIPRLSTVEKDGDTVGGTIDYTIKVYTDNANPQEYKFRATGKTTSLYERDHRINLPRGAASQWRIEVIRETADSTSDTVQNTLQVQSYTEIIDAKLRYPLTALLAVEFDAKNFPRTPLISIKMKGRKVDVPTNYDPINRTYSGSWDGSFKRAWTNNPAWIWYDICKNDIFGLGRWIKPAMLNRYALYEISQRCDQQVPDGKGGDGKEPRFLCDVYIQDKVSGWQLLKDIASIFAGMTWWGNQMMNVVSDGPVAATSHVLTNANVIDGAFTYASGSGKTKYSTFIVNYSDPQNHYKDTPTAGQRPDLVRRFKINQTSLKAIGCTRESEAQRRGHLVLVNSDIEDQVTFKVGLEGLFYIPGMVVPIADWKLSGGAEIRGGRCNGSGTTVNTDQPITWKAGDHIQVRNAAGVMQDIEVTLAEGTKLTLASSVGTLADNTPFVIDGKSIQTQLYKITKVKRADAAGVFEVTGLLYNPDKWDAVDNGARLDPRILTEIPDSVQPAPESVTITPVEVLVQSTRRTNLDISWPKAAKALAYEVQFRRMSLQDLNSWSNDWINLPRTASQGVTIENVTAGTYMARVRAIGNNEASSPWVESPAVKATGRAGAVPAPINLAPAGKPFGIHWSWAFAAGTDDTAFTELVYKVGQTGQELPLANVAYPGKLYEQMGLARGSIIFVKARLRDRLGNVSPWTAYVQGMASDNTDDYFNGIDEAIKGSNTYDELTGGIKDVSDAAAAAQAAADAAKGVADKATSDLAATAATVAQQGRDLTSTTTKANDALSKVAQEAKDRAAADTAAAKVAADATAAAVKKAETDDAAVAKKAADDLLNQKNAVDAQISTVNQTIQDVNDSLALQIASLSAGSGEQFDFKSIWYFDQTSEGWSDQDSGTPALPVTADGWLKPAGASATMKSPPGTGTDIDAKAYKYLRLRIRKVGNPTWQGRIFWIGQSEQGWDSANRSKVVPEPSWDTNGVTVLSVSDLPWTGSAEIRRIRLDLASGATAANTYEVDWIAVGRPTPGASQAQIQQLQKAMTDADSAEATQRNQLAVQLRGSETGTDPNKLTSGLLFEERKIRVTAEQAIGSKVDTLRVDYDKSTAAASSRMDTIASDLEATSTKTDQVAADLATANGVIGGHTTAIQQIQAKNTAQDGSIQSNAQAITGLSSTLNNDALAQVVNPNNLLTNTGFERDKDGWTGWSSLSDVYAAQAPRGGVKILRGKAGGNAAITQNVLNVKKGRTYRFGGWVKRSADMTIGPNTVGNNKFRLGNATGGNPLSELNFSQDNVGTGWTLLTKDYTFFSDMTLAYSVNWNLATGEIYFDDVFFMDVTDEVNITANADAVSGLSTRVTAAEGKIETAAAQTTSLKAQLANGNEILNGDMASGLDMWVLSGAGSQLPKYAENEKAMESVGSNIRVANSTRIVAEPGLKIRVTLEYRKLAADFNLGTNKLMMMLVDRLDSTAAIAMHDSWANNITTSFQTATIDLTIPDTFTGDTVYFRIACGGWTPSTTQIRIRNVLVTKLTGIGQKADSQAVATLSATVTQQGKDITAAAQNIVSLSNRLDTTDAEVSKKATQVALDSLKATVTQQGKDITANATATTNLGNTVAQNKKDNDDAWTAQGTTNQTLDQKITTVDGRVTNVSQAVTAVDAKIDTVKTDLGKAIATKADSQTVQQLDAKVTQQGQDITTNAQAITGIKGRLDTVEDGLSKAATAAAVSQLSTKVDTIDGKVTSQGEAITSVTAGLIAAKASGGDYIPNPTFDRAYNNMGYNVVDTVDDATNDGIPYDPDVPAGAPYRYVAKLSARDHQANFNSWPVKPGQVFEMSIWIACKAGGVAPFNLYLGSATQAQGGVGARNGYGNVQPSQTWQKLTWRFTIPNNWPAGQTYMRPFLQINQSGPAFGTTWYATDWHCREVTAANEAKVAADAVASSVTALTGTVTQQGKDITAANQSLTNLANRVTNVENDNTAQGVAISNLQTTTTQQGKDITTQGNAITQVQGQIAALRDGGENLVQNFDLRQGSLFWSVQQDSVSKVEFGDYGDGKPGVRMTRANSTSPGLFANNKRPVPLNGQRRFRMVAKLKRLDSAGSANVLFRRWNYNGLTEGTYTDKNVAITDTWAVYTHDFDPTPATGFNGSSFGIYLHPSNGQIAVDYIAVYDITDATAIDANSSAITGLTNTVTQQGKDIAANAAATTAVSASLDADKLDRDNAAKENLLVNGTFERGQEGFTGWNQYSTTPVLQQPHSGTRALRMAAGGSAGIGQEIDIVQNRTYRMSVWAKQDAGTTIQDVGNTKFRVADSTGLLVGSNYGPFTGAWQKVSFEWKASKTTRATFQLTTWLSAGAMYFDDFVVEDITDALADAAWKKASADAASTLGTKVDTIDDKVTAQGQAITSVQAGLTLAGAKSLNPFIDGSFESYTNNQQIAGQLFIATNEAMRDGRLAGKVTRNNGETGNSDKTTSPWLAVRSGGKYRYSCWVMMKSDQQPSSGWQTLIGMMTRGENDSGNNWPTAIVVNEAALTAGRDKWVQVTGILTVNSAHAQGALWISTRGASGGTGYSLYIDGFTITDVTDAAAAQASADAAASAVTGLTSTVTQQGKDITATSTALGQLTSRVGSAESKITNQDETIAANGLAMSNGLRLLQTQYADNSAKISTVEKTVTDINGALSTRIDTVEVKAGDASAAVQTVSEAVADINGKLGAQWGVKVQTNADGSSPRVAGIQLGIDGSGASEFLVNADIFGVYANGGKNLVFATDNNGAYLRQAMARNLTIDFAQIANNIQSTNYIENQQGWAINKNGGAQFNNAIFRGAVYATDGWFQGTVYANRIEGDIGSFAINIAQHRTRKVPKATWQWFELARFRRQNFDQVINIRGGLLQTDSINIDGGAKLRAGMSYSPGSDGGLDPGYLSYAMLLRGTGATSGGGSMEIGIELAYETGGATRLLTAQESMNVDNMSFVVPAGTGDAILRYGCYLDRNGQMVLTILSRFDAFAARNNNVIRASSTP